MKNKFLLLFSIILSVIFSGFLFFYGFNNFNKINLVSSQTNSSLKPLYGYAWSSNIGWISFNCENEKSCNTSDYKVLVDVNSGDLSGYAWSNNIGWIRFDPQGPYPESPNSSAKIDFSNKIVSGWIRACDVFLDNTKCEGELEKFYRRGGWDGWINITNAKIGNGGLTGWAWGDLNVGWINFSGLINLLPYEVKLLHCDFYADPTSIVLPKTSTLNWQCQFADSCEINNGIGNVNSSSGSIVVRPSKTTTYNLTCNGLDGSTSVSADVGVSQAGGAKIRYEEVIPR